MTDTPTPPPAGWYPAPDGSSAPWWWDGARWTQPQPALQPSQEPGTTKAIAKLGMATQVLVIGCGVMSVATIGIEAFGINAVAVYFSGGQTSAIDMFNVYDQGTSVVAILSTLSLIAAGVLWVVWQYRVAKQVPGRTRRSAGWHAGSWFVPIISLWFPYQNISDLWRAVGRTRPSWQIIWWVLWVASNVVIQTSTRIYLVAQDLEQLSVSMWLSIAGQVLLLAAAPLAWLIIRGITQGILHRSSVLVDSPEV